MFRDKTVLNTFLPHWITSHSLPIPSMHSANFAPKNCHIFGLGDVVPQPGFQTMSFNKHIISIPALRSQIWVEDILLKIRGVDKSVKPSFAANVINLLEPSSPTTQIRRKMMKLIPNATKLLEKEDIEWEAIVWDRMLTTWTNHFDVSTNQQISQQSLGSHGGE